MRRRGAFGSLPGAGGGRRAVTSHMPGEESEGQAASGAGLRVGSGDGRHRQPHYGTCLSKTLSVAEHGGL